MRKFLPLIFILLSVESVACSISREDWEEERKKQRHLVKEFVKKQAKIADLIVIGTVVNVTEAKKSSGYYYKALVQIDKVIKGNPSSQESIYTEMRDFTPDIEDSCDTIKPEDAAKIYTVEETFQYIFYISDAILIRANRFIVWPEFTAHDEVTFLKEKIDLTVN